MVQMKMIKMILTVMLFFAFAGSAFSYTEDKLTEHDPIYIEGNSQFEDSKGSIRGVVSGKGVQNDPYIIAFHDIKTGEYGGIKIKDTDAYFIIRKCNIHGDGTTNTNGIIFEGVENGKVENVELRDNYIGIYINGSTNNFVIDTTISGSRDVGIEIHDSENSIIASTTISGSGDDGIEIHDSENSIIASTTISGSGSDGVYIDGEYNKLFKCDITNNRQGIHQSRFYSDNNTASFCNIYNNEEYGVYNNNYNDRFEAINCWWGSENGPSGVGPGDGDKVGEKIDYEPYLSVKVDIKSSE